MLRRRWLASVGYGIAILAFIVGCHRGQESPSTEAIAAEPFIKPPSVLDQALLLYHDNKGILLSRPASGSAPVRVTRDGRYPRWFPDGRRFVFIRGGNVVLHDLADESEIVLAAPGNPSAVAVNAVGDEVLYIADKAIYRVRDVTGTRETLRVDKLLHGADFRELAMRGNRIVTTTKTQLRGYGVYLHEPPYGDGRRLGKGCSAGLSPDGTIATVNLRGHTKLALIDLPGGKARHVVPTPPGLALDNQCWSNHPDWITAVSHENRVYLQRVPDGAVWAVIGPDGDRPSLFIKTP